MSWLAVKNSPEAPRTFRNVIGVVILYWVASSFLAPDEPEVIVSGDALNPDIEVIPQHVSPTQYLLYKIVNWAFALYTLIVMMKLYVPLFGVPPAPIWSYCILSPPFVLFLFIASSLFTFFRRRAVRERYSIPNSTCFPSTMEDCCCAFFCGCCTVSQLARHTADYHDRNAACCSNTGLQPRPEAQLHAVVLV
jgi:Cys-rich protein (TIGR01571 family)